MKDDFKWVRKSALRRVVDVKGYYSKAKRKLFEEVEQGRGEREIKVGSRRGTRLVSLLGHTTRLTNQLRSDARFPQLAHKLVHTRYLHQSVSVIQTLIDIYPPCRPQLVSEALSP